MGQPPTAGTPARLVSPLLIRYGYRPFVAGAVIALSLHNHPVQASSDISGGPKKRLVPISRLRPFIGQPPTFGRPSSVFYKFKISYGSNTFIPGRALFARGPVKVVTLEKLPVRFKLYSSPRTLAEGSLISFGPVREADSTLRSRGISVSYGSHPTYFGSSWIQKIPLTGTPPVSPVVRPKSIAISSYLAPIYNGVYHHFEPVRTTTIIRPKASIISLTSKNVEGKVLFFGPQRPNPPSGPPRPKVLSQATYRLNRLSYNLAGSGIGLWIPGTGSAPVIKPDALLVKYPRLNLNFYRGSFTVFRPRHVGVVRRAKSFVAIRPKQIVISGKAIFIGPRRPTIDIQKPKEFLVFSVQDVITHQGSFNLSRPRRPDPVLVPSRIKPFQIVDRPGDRYEGKVVRFKGHSKTFIRPKPFTIYSKGYSQYNPFRKGKSQRFIRPAPPIVFASDCSWGGHFQSRGWNSPQDQINAGYPIYIQPTELTGSYEEVIDYGTALTNIIVITTFNVNAITPSDAVTVVVKMAVSDDNVTYTAFTSGAAQFFAGFRYLKLRLEFIGANDKALIELFNLTVDINVKREIDSGEVIADKDDAAGTIVTFNKAFKDVDSITLTVESVEPVTAIKDFQDIPNPTTFKILAYDSSGNRITYPVSWKARGIV